MPLRLLDTIALGHSLHSFAASRDGSLLYVGLDRDNCISVVDLETGGIQGRIDLPGSPTDVAISPNGSTAVVTALVRELHGDRGYVYVIDLRDGRLTADFRAGFNPQTVSFSPQGSSYYVCEFTGRSDTSPPGALRVFRSVDHLLLATLDTGDHSFFAAASPDGNYVYVSTVFAHGSVAIVDANALEVTGFVTGMGGDPAGVAVSPGGTRVYVAANSASRVTIVDAMNGVSTQWVDVSPDPLSVILNPDHAEMYVSHGPQFSSSQPVSSVSVIDTATHEVIQTAQFDGSGYRMAMSRDGSRIYCMDTEGGAVAVFAVE